MDLLGAGSSLLTSVANMIYENRQADKQYERNKEMMNLENQWSLDMWNRTNQYNDPSAQIARLRNAGLNPMFYGLDGSSAQSFQSAEALGYERAGASNLENPLQGALMAAQLENTQADTAKKNEESKSEVQRRQNMKTELDKMKQEIQNLIKSGNLTDKEIERLELSNKWIDKLNAANEAYTNSLSRLNDANTRRIDELLEGEKILQSKTIEDFDHQWELLDAKIKQIAAETELTYKDIEYYILTHLDSGFQGTGLSIRNLLLLGDEIYNKAKKGNSDFKGNVNDVNPWQGDPNVPPGYNGTR